MAGIDRAQARRNALAEGDPVLLVGQDIIRYAEALMREEHRVLGDDFQFWGGVADWFNDIACLPERRAAQTSSAWSRFNSAIRTAVGYIRMSTASQEVKMDLLRKYFPAPNEGQVYG